MHSSILFVTIVGAVLLALILAAERISSHGALTPRTTWLITGGIVLFRVAVPGVLASRGALDKCAPFPTLQAAVMVAITLGTTALAVTRFGKALSVSVPLAAIVGYQVFRLPLELVLHRLHTEGVIPKQMTFTGRNLDIVTGVAAIAVGAAIHLNRCPRWLLLLWNVVGLALLINIVAVAVLSSPVQFRQFLNEPTNLLPSTFPYVWLPTFLVQAALFGHLVVLRATWR
jgi:hypothetical protein